MRKLTHEDFFFCYSVYLFKYLFYEKNFEYIACGWHEKKPHIKFWMFQRTPELEKAINEYSKRRKEVS